MQQRPDVQLLDVDKEQLRALSREGGPLYKIFKQTLDYCDQLAQYIVALDLNSEEGLKSARQLQLERTASLNYVKWFIQQFADYSLDANLKDHLNG